MAVWLGLSTAVLWGVSDFLIRVIGRGVGVFRSMLYAQGLGAVAISLWLLAAPAGLAPLATSSTSALASAVVAAPIGLLATYSLYEGMRVGRVGLVAPIVSAYGAVAAALSMLTGEPVGQAALGGMVLIVAGSVLVSKPGRAAPSTGRSPGGREAGLVWSLVACVGYGLQFWIQGRFATPELGAVIPVWIYYVFSTASLSLLAFVRRPPLRVAGRDAVAVLATGIVAVLGFLVMSAGLATGEIAIVGILASLQSTVTVGLAAMILGERLALHQWAGVGALAAGLGLIHA